MLRFRWFCDENVAVSRRMIDRFRFQIWKVYWILLWIWDSEHKNMIWKHYSGLGLRAHRSRPKVKNLQLGSNVRFVKIQILRSLWPYICGFMGSYWLVLVEPQEKIKDLKKLTQKIKFWIVDNRILRGNKVKLQPG